MVYTSTKVRIILFQCKKEYVTIMKIIAINGSPRKDGNSAKLLQSWVDGFKYLYPDAEVEMVHLFFEIYWMSQLLCLQA